jgi:hypothetical protein
MQVRCIEDLAGGALSREKLPSGASTLWRKAEGNTGWRARASTISALRGLRGPGTSACGPSSSVLTEGDWPYLWIDTTYEGARGRAHRFGGGDDRGCRQHRWPSRGTRDGDWCLGSRDLLDRLPPLAQAARPRRRQAGHLRAHEASRPCHTVFRATWQRCRVQSMRNALIHAGNRGRGVVSAFTATAFTQDHVTPPSPSGGRSPGPAEAAQARCASGRGRGRRAAHQFGALAGSRPVRVAWAAPILALVAAVEGDCVALAMGS